MGIKEHLSQPYTGAGIAYDLLTEQRFADEKCLERYGYKVYSQNDEDGIIAEIFRRIGTTDKTFVEFGVQDGLECNSHYLLHRGWHGLWLEGSGDSVKEIVRKFNPVIQTKQLKVQPAFITKDNINELIAINGIVGNIDLLSVDIDGNDYYVWKAIRVVSPRVVIIEYNAKFPPDCEWKQAYNETHIWDGSDWQGASLKAMELLGRKLGYRLVGTNLNGTNAFFVQENLAKDLFLEPATAENLYNPARYYTLRWVSGHPAKYCLCGQLPNIGAMNYDHDEYLRYKDSRSVSPELTEEDNALVRQRMVEAGVHKDTMCRKLKYGQATFYLPLAESDIIQRFIMYTGAYFESELLHKIFLEFRGGLLSQVLAQEGSVVVDIGANIGNHTLYFALERHASKVISFEAVEETYRILARNIELNNLQDRTEIYCLGLSDQAGMADIGRRYAGNIGGTELAVGSGNIKLVALDSFNLPRVDLIKIDVEGMEPQVLKGAEETIRRCRPYIMTESFPDKKPLVEDFMADLGYRGLSMAENDFLFYPVSAAKRNGDILSAPYDIVIPVSETYADVLATGLDFVRENLSHRRIVLVCSPGVFARFADKGVEFCNENEVWPGLSLDALTKYLAVRDGAAVRHARYYFRQLVALKYADICEQDRYLLWHPESVPLQPFTFEDLTQRIYFYMKPGRREEHFTVIRKLFGRPMKILTHDKAPSFIAEGVLVNTAAMREMMSEMPGESWRDILNVLTGAELVSQGFSLSEIYGTYMLNRYPDRITGKTLTTVDDGYATYGRLLNGDELARLPFNAITFPLTKCKMS